MFELIGIVVFIVFWLAGSYLNWTVTKDSAAKFRTTHPDGGESPTVLDSHGQNTRKGFQERLDIDHVFAVDGDGGMDGGDTGKHKQVNFVDPLGEKPTAAASEGIVYTLDVNEKAELHYVDEDTKVTQITSAGNLLLTAAAVEAAKASILDETTVESNSGVIQLKAGAASDVGILWEHLSTDAAAFCDDDTLEIDGTNGLQAKTPATPSAGSDYYADACGISVFAYGSYTVPSPNSANKTIDTGITIKKLKIKGTVSAEHGIDCIVNDAGQKAWDQADGSTRSGLTVSGQKFTVDADTTQVCVDGRTYYWFAEGIRI